VHAITIAVIYSLLLVSNGQVKADVTVSGQVEVTYTEIEAASTTQNSSRSTGRERLMKIGVWSALAYNQDEIDGILSGMSNSAVREPVGSVVLGYGKVDSLTAGDAYTDSITGGLTVPVGENFGLNVGGSRTQWKLSASPGSHDKTQLYLFNGNPKEGSFGIGFSRNRSMTDGASDISANDMHVGYDWRDAKTASVKARYTKLLGNSVGIDGHEKNIGGKLYLNDLILSLEEEWVDMRYDNQLNWASRESSKDVKYEGDQFTLFGGKRTIDLELSVWLPMQGNYNYNDNYNYNYSTVGATYYPSDNLALTVTRHGMDYSYNSYRLIYQPPSAKYRFLAQAINKENSWGHYQPATFRLSLILNLGRKQSLKSADRDRDPY